MNLIIAFISHDWAEIPFRFGNAVGWTNSTANQSRRSGWDGHSTCEPKSSEVFTIPTPKSLSHKRLTQTRAVSGCSPVTNHWAKPKRFMGAPLGNGGNAAGNALPTFSLFWSYSPRCKIWASRRVFLSCMTKVEGTLSINLLNFSLALLTSISATFNGVWVFSRKCFLRTFWSTDEFSTDESSKETKWDGSINFWFKSA